MNAFAWIRNLNMILIMLFAALTTLKGANFGIFGAEKKPQIISSYLTHGY